MFKARSRQIQGVDADGNVGKAVEAVCPTGGFVQYSGCGIDERDRGVLHNSAGLIGDGALNTPRTSGLSFSSGKKKSREQKATATRRRLPSHLPVKGVRLHFQASKRSFCAIASAAIQACVPRFSSLMAARIRLDRIEPTYLRGRTTIKSGTSVEEPTWNCQGKIRTFLGGS